MIGGPDPGGFAKEHMAQFFDVSNTQIEFQNAQFTTSDIHYWNYIYIIYTIIIRYLPNLFENLPETTNSI